MFLYNLVVRLYGIVIRVSSFNNIKAKQWVSGRRQWRKNLQQKISNQDLGEKIWVHCASYGEFEQGRPLIEALKEKYPKYKIVLSFFSPSGFEAFKSWSGADVICYIPLDTKTNARDFLDIIKPKAVIFIKYEFWLYFLFELKKREIPTYLISAVFKNHHPFFKWYGGIFRKSLGSFSKLFIQDEHSGELLKEIGIQNYEIMGDTRFDRVMDVKKKDFTDAKIQKFKGANKLIIAGSTWASDEDLIIESFNLLKGTGVKLMIAPHEVGQKFIEATIKKLTQKNLSFAVYKRELAVDENAQVLILNTIGVLAKSYYYANCAYIGGGFNGGLHNVLEPAVFGIPVSFYGNKYLKYNEAVELVNLGLASNVNSADELAINLKKQLFDENYCKQASEKLEVYFQKNGNVTEKIIETLHL